LPVVWYASGIQSVILKEKLIFREFRIVILRKIFVSKTEEATEGWRKLHSNEYCICLEPKI
jgi:hypothetical protein